MAKKLPEHPWAEWAEFMRYASRVGLSEDETVTQAKQKFDEYFGGHDEKTLARAVTLGNGCGNCMAHINSSNLALWNTVVNEFRKLGATVIDNPKSVREQIREMKARVRREFKQREAQRMAKLLAALAEYFADKWQEEIDVVRSDTFAASMAEVQGGVYVFLKSEAQDEPGYYLKRNAAALALEKLRERGFKVELDTVGEYPDVYKVWEE